MATVEPERESERDPDDSFVVSLGARYPEALVLAVLLAFAALLATVPFLGALEQVRLFSTGFFRLFQVQMALVLWWLLSASVVESTPVGAALDRLAARVPTSQRAVVATTALVALVGGWINWALGLVGAVLLGQRLCRDAAEDGVAVHYPLVLVGALLSLVTSTVGVTSPGALLVADDSGTTNFLVESTGAIPFADFVLYPANIATVGVLVLTLPVVLAWLAPDDPTTMDEDDAVLAGSIRETLAHYDTPDEEDQVAADRLENSRVLTVTVFVVGAVSIGWQWVSGAGVAMLGVLFALMMLALLVQRRPMAFVGKVSDATRWVEHLVVPFLLYAGVYALLLESGLYDGIGGILGSAVLPHVATYAVALAVGLLVPDPGSVWVLLGPGAALAAGGTTGHLVATMLGAGLSNLWLGFVFLGVLGVRGTDTREFVRYAAGITVYVSAVGAVALALL